MDCEYTATAANKDGTTTYVCKHCQHQRSSKYPASKLRRRCPSLNPTGPPARVLLGDRIAEALTGMGITEERVTKWLGRPCGCRERRERLNALQLWVERKVKGMFGSVKEAEEELEEMLD